MLGSPLKKAFRLRLKLTWLPATRPNLVGKDKEGNKMKWLRRLTGMTRQMGFKEKCGLGLKLKGKKKKKKWKNMVKGKIKTAKTQIQT